MSIKNMSNGYGEYLDPYICFRTINLTLNTYQPNLDLT